MKIAHEIYSKYLLTATVQNIDVVVNLFSGKISWKSKRIMSTRGSISLKLLMFSVAVPFVSGCASALSVLINHMRDIFVNIGHESAQVMFLSLDPENETKLVYDVNPLFRELNDSYLIFTDASKLPRRNSYSPNKKVSPGTIGKHCSSFIKLIILLTEENLNVTTDLHLLQKVRTDYDMFIIIGEESHLRRFFRTPFGIKLRIKLGIICNTEATTDVSVNSSSAFLIDPEIYTKGEMELVSSITKPVLNLFSLNGRHLKVSANTLRPYIIVKGPQNVTGGTHYMILTHTAATYNFTLEWDIDPTRGNGKLAKDGTASGMLGDVLNGKADVAFIARLTLGQIGVIDLTTSNYVDTLVFITRNPEATLEWTAVIHLFTTGTWGIILLVFLVLIPLYYVILQRTPPSQRKKPFQAFMIPFGVFITQSLPKIPEKAYLITFFWMIFVLNINIAYNSNLSSFLTKVQPETIPSSFDDLAARLDYNVTFNYLNNGSCDCFHFFNDSMNPDIISIKNRFMANLEPDTGRCILHSLMRRRTVCIGWESVTRIGIAQNATLYGGLNLVRVSKSVHSSLNSIGFQRHSIYTLSFDRIIGRFRDMGIVIHLKNEAEAFALDEGQTWLNERKHSGVYKVLKRFVDDMYGNVKPFKLTHFKFAYLLLFGGIFLASVSFLLELVANSNNTKNVVVVEYFP